MEGLLILLAIVFAGLVLLGVPVALVRQGSLQRQIRDLQKDLGKMAQEMRDMKRRGVSAAEDTVAKRATPQEPASVTADKPEEVVKTVWPGKTARPVEPERPAAVAASTADKAARTAVPAVARKAPTPPPEQPRAFVFSEGKMEQLVEWLKVNWVLAIAAASLAFAGLFMVQYGIEHGVLSPFWRVMAALGFGGALVAAGEYVRRRYGDEDDPVMRHMPSVLSGAGVATLFAGVLAARVMYGLIGSNTALVGLVLVSLFAMVLGWFYGPVLAAIGIIGAMAAPFVLSTGAGAPPELYYYFVLVILMALGIDTVKRWAWISVLGLVLGIAAIWLLYAADTGDFAFAASIMIVTLGAMTIPVRSLVPNHAGAALSEMLGVGERKFAEFPTRLAGGVVAVATLAALSLLLSGTTAAEVWLGFGMLLMLFAAVALWAEGARALYDLVVFPAGGLLAGLLLHGLQGGVLVQELLRGVSSDPEVNAPNTGWLVYTLVALGAFISLVGFWRMTRALRVEGAKGDAPLTWALGAAVFAPAVFLILEFVWPVSYVIGSYPWALVAVALAAFMTLLAERCARAGNGDSLMKARTGLFALAALTLIAMALFLILTKTALSLALAAMVVLIILADRKFELPMLGWFVQIGVAVITYRLVADPGIYWAVNVASAFDAFVAYAGVIALLAAAWWFAGNEAVRMPAKVAVESAIWLIALVGIGVALFRVFEDDLFSHWGLGLWAVIWGGAFLAQLYRLDATRYALQRGVRYVLMLIFGGFAGLCLAAQFVAANPLFGGLFGRELVRGPYIFDSLMVAYLPVAAMFAFAAWKFAKRVVVMQAGYALAGIYSAIYVIYETRRLFRGDRLSVRGFTDGELYAYTLLMLVTSIVLLLLAYKRRSVNLRKLAMAGVALTIAKVFLVDMSGLSGLTRVFSFMGLGLALLGLTWLNRVLAAGWNDGGKDGGGGSVPPTPPVAPKPEPEPEAVPEPESEAEPTPEPEPVPEKPEPEQTEAKPKRKAKPVRPKKD
ncbi:DUF2339 domain-containing protein [Lentibacter sp. XHP0401]|uniref:DUF2339 domain-containing protein n=1 Tax=Lentibacter sp. XHP0401 TaxID=2984334 RepID=UPI0021E8157A|nr:DUF2339 domain-containing protein [Lentibacter sp. XHP0401]MCV2894166.1 DUF2339 domain-containing protein [Lentibacter sp. XHP0401]